MITEVFKTLSTQRRWSLFKAIADSEAEGRSVFELAEAFSVTEQAIRSALAPMINLGMVHCGPGKDSGYKSRRAKNYLASDWARDWLNSSAKIIGSRYGEQISKPKDCCGKSHVCQ